MSTRERVSNTNATKSHGLMTVSTVHSNAAAMNKRALIFLLPLDLQTTAIIMTSGTRS